MTVPSDRNIALREIEKKSKYKDLELEIQRKWQMTTVDSKEGDDRKHQESIRESYCERDLKDRSACWDLRESTERCLVYEQNDWLE